MKNWPRNSAFSSRLEETSHFCYFDPQFIFTCMSQERLISRIADLWEEGIKEDVLIIEKIQHEFQLSRNDAEWILELTQAGFLRAGLIISKVNYPTSNLNNNLIVKTATKIALERLGKSDLYNEPNNRYRWWKFWK